MKLTYHVAGGITTLAGIEREDGSIVCLGNSVVDGDDMRRMVHAANCHDELVAACEQMRTAVVDIEDDEQIDAAKAAVDAALARARGENGGGL